MKEATANEVASTPGATAMVAQESSGRERAELPVAESLHSLLVGAGKEDVHFTIGTSVTRALLVRPYERTSKDPVYRPLRIFSVDPSLSRLDGAEAIVNVPYEPLAPGPVGALFAVDDYDESTETHWGRVDLDEPALLMQDGRRPSAGDPLSHQQMVYAVATTVYATFRRALGRQLNWGFEPRAGRDGAAHQLILRPHAAEEGNAYYDRERGEVRFGYCRAATNQARLVPQGVVFTCLSHDVVAHEITHALLDGLRQNFGVPTSPDVLAFHEGFADLVALFQHFTYDEVVRAAMRTSRGRLEQAAFLTDIAQEFGAATGSGGALRSAVEELSQPGVEPESYSPEAESHKSGEVLVRAVFEAFLTVFNRKTARYWRLASNGTGVLPPGELPADLQAVLAGAASKLASQFLAICIRAIDYCPPVDLELGEYLRALVTADHDLVPDDPWGYREALIDAFARRRIFPPGVNALGEDSLLWQAAPRHVPPIPRLHFAALQFAGDPAQPADAQELRTQARALGALLADPLLLESFGLAAPDNPALERDTVDLPCIHSIRTSRRVGPDGQVLFDLVAELTQTRHVADGGGTFPFHGGATVIIGPQGEIRYLIAKNVLNSRRLERQRQFIAGRGRGLWELTDAGRAPRKNAFALLCQHHAGNSPQKPAKPRASRAAKKSGTDAKGGAASPKRPESADPLGPSAA